MDAPVLSDATPSEICSINEIKNDKSAHKHSPSSTSKQEVNKQDAILSNGDTLNDEQVPVDEHVNSDNNSNKSCVENVSSESDVQKNSKKGKKNVFFPVDSKIVKGYLDPPDPWKNVPDWRTEDLLRAYKKGCEKHGTKPLNKVLQQLQCIENVGERYEILSLKGERLDLKQCESLEDIFKHVRFRCVDVEATHLDDEMAVALFEMVEYYESACKLNISFNKGIGPRGWMSCSKLVRRTPCLTFIDARNCDLNERVIPIMGRALRMGCFLQRLHLQSTGLAGRALVILVAALKMNETLKELFLGDNKFMPTDGVQIGNLLKYNHKLELLDLRNNHLQDVGVGHVCEGLIEQCLDTGLLTLVLWNNQITFQGMSSVSKALTSAENLETLNLGHNPITNEGIHILKDGLLKSKGLLKLGLSGTKISCEGAVALAEVIADNTRLVRLDLQENDIRTAGLMALSLALKVNESITRLDIDRDTKKESGVKDYADQQRRLQKEINSLLERNRDLMHKHEEEQKQIEIRNKENARKLQEAACDISVDEGHEYIPSGDSIHRPKLLFLPLPQMCPEHELDSPVLGEELIFEAIPPAQTLQLAPPTGTDLLSPQYCPNPKATAKKIFSVTRVTSPTGLSSKGMESSSGFPFKNFNTAVSDSSKQVHSPGCGIDSTSSRVIPHLVPPLPTVDLPSITTPIPLTMDMHTTSDNPSPSSLQRVIENQTLVSYIKQIVDDSSGPVNTTTGNENEQLKSKVEEKFDKEGNCSNNAGGRLSQNISETNIFVNQNSQVDNNVKQDLQDKNKNGQDTIDGSVVGTALKSTSERGEVETVDICSKQFIVEAVKDTENKSECYRNSNSTCCDNTQSKNIPEIEVSNKTVQDKTTDDCGLIAETDLYSKSVLGIESTYSSQTEVLSILDSGFQEVQNSEPKSLSEFDMPNVSNSSQEDNSNNVNGEFLDCVDTMASKENINGTEGNKLKNIRTEQSQNQENDKENGDTEPWNTVNKSDIVDSMTSITDSDCALTGSSNKPDFHTDLSFNGLRQELASLIDEEVGSSPASPAVANCAIVKASDNTDTYTQNGAETTSDWLDTVAMDAGASS